jgi:hypothetical protein
MQYHQNSVSPQGIFKDISPLNEKLLINFSMTQPEKQQLCSILAECMIEEVLVGFGPDENGEFYMNDDQVSPMNGFFDLGGYYEKVLVRSAQMLAVKMGFDAEKVAAVILTYKVALFTEFKLYFADIDESSIVIFGQTVRPKGDYMDLHELIQLTINKLGTFL